MRCVQLEVLLPKRDPDSTTVESPITNTLGRHQKSIRYGGYSLTEAGLAGKRPFAHLGAGFA